MRVLISGICGFVGSTIARALRESDASLRLHGCDNFSRPGSETNRPLLKNLGIGLTHADVRAASDVEGLPPCDWIIDAAANPSVLAGVDGRSSARQLVEHNLGGTANLLEHARRHAAGFILLSTSRVYSIAALAALPLEDAGAAFRLLQSGEGFTPHGITERFSTTAPVSLYGATKLASEALALEYGGAFNLPVFVNRCGLLAGGGQFGRPDQGIVAYWVNSWMRRRPLHYLGFGGRGLQVRDCLHPRDLALLLQKQLTAPVIAAADRVLNVAGGAASARSLRQLSDWCAANLGPHGVAASDAPRPFDLPWVVLDAGRAEAVWGWRPQVGIEAIWEEIAAHGEAHPDWLELSASY